MGGCWHWEGGPPSPPYSLEVVKGGQTPLGDVGTAGH